MKKINYILLLLFFFCVGVYTGHENPEITSGVKQAYKFLFNVQKITIKTNQMAEVKSDFINANSFDLYFKKKMTVTNQSTALFVDEKNIFEAISFNGNVENNNSIKEIKKTFNFYGKKEGGIRAAFEVNKKKFILQSNKTFNCYYASLVRVQDSKELIKSECLPDENKIDFSGLGGGYINDNNFIYLAIGVPTHQSAEIDKLAQDLDSIFGKIIKINIDDLLNLKTNKLTYEIFSSGHRNPQGLAIVDKNIYNIEHGPHGGDEINLIMQNKNYGWPIYSLGVPYTRDRNLHLILDKKFTMPLYTFLPAVAPSDLSECPKNLKEYYSDFDCLLALSLRAQSLFVILIESDEKKLISFEKIEFGERLRKFGKNKLMKLYEDNKSAFYIISDQNNIYEFKFKNFINNEKN